MDIGLFAKSQSLSLISFPPPSPSPSSSRVRTLRREFLGCGHNLRLPGLLSLRRCSKLGLHCRSHRFLVRASLHVQSVVLVVSVVTLSVLTVVFLNYSQRKKNSGKEVLGQISLALSQQVQGILNRLIKNQSFPVLDLERLITAHERKEAPEEVLERRYESEDEMVKQQLEETALMPEGTLITDTVEIPSYVTSCVAGSLSLGESEVADPSFPLPMPSEPNLVQRADLLVQNQLNDANDSVNTAHAGIDEHKGTICELNEVDEIIGHSVIFTEPPRKGLYAFYEANHSQAESILNLNGPNMLSSQTSQRNYNGFSSLKRNSVTDGVNLLAKSSIHTKDFTEDRFVSSESTEGKIPIAHFRKGPSHKSADLAKSKGITKEKESRNLPQDGRKYSSQPAHPNRIHVNGRIYTSQPSHPNGMHASDKHYPSRQISDYNNLLKAGRLIDCLELLEGMERKGLLDMDKVYHVGFFKTCQKQRAVKEAFRFTKLIPNPTLSTFNMLISVCASSQDSEGAFQVMQLVQEAGLKADCKLYTTLISTCAKSGKVDAMFKVFHEMLNAEVEPNIHTYGALIDGCAKAGQVAKAFGAYGIMRSKNVKPDRVIFNALITACGQSGAVDRAFDVLAEMTTETRPIDPDHITVGALMKACANAGQVDRARETYNMIHKYNIKGTPEVYTIAVNSCSQTADWEFACSVYSDMTRKGVIPDETFLSAMIDVAGHAGKLDAAFGIIQEARKHGMRLGTISYSSLMGACSNAKNWQKALELYENIKSLKLKPTVSMMNALITALCDGDQLQKALEVLSEMKRVGLCPNTITYSILLVASEKKDDLDVGLLLLSQAKEDGVTPSLAMSRCLIAMCLRRFEKACVLGEPVLSVNLGQPQIDCKWTSLALMVYRETIIAGVIPTIEVFSQVLGCLQLPRDASVRNRLIENLAVSTDSPKRSNLCSLVDGFGEYDPRAFSLFEEAASLGIVPCVSFQKSPIVIDARKLHIHTAEVYLSTVLKGLKHRLAAGARLPNITILLPMEETQIQSPKGEKTINIAGRISRVVAALLRRLGLTYQGNESNGKVRINGVVVKRWLQPKHASPFSGKPIELSSSLSRLGKGISNQQRNIRTGNLSLE